MIYTGAIANIDNDYIFVKVPRPKDIGVNTLLCSDVGVQFNDGRIITADQRKKIYATMRDISLWNGDEPDYIKLLMKHWFVAYTGGKMFSLSNVDITTANEFLNFLIELCIEQDIPTMDSLSERTPDTARYIYACLVNKKCCVCGTRSELHHVNTVGMGRNRREINHIGMRAEPLCRRHHSEAHTIGQQSFDEKYHVFGVKIERNLAGIYRL